MKIKAKLTFTVTKDNPDFKYINDENKILEFEDTYTFEDTYDIEDAIRYIKHDMLLVAGGGYSTQHVNVIEWDIERI